MGYGTPQYEDVCRRCVQILGYHKDMRVNIAKDWSILS